MVREYAEKLYIPAATRGERMRADGMAKSVELATVKDRLRAKWPGVKVVGVHTSGNGHFKVGQTMQVESMVDLASWIRPTCRCSYMRAP